MLAVLPAARAAAEQDLQVKVQQGWVLASFRYRDPPGGEVVTALQEGLASEIQFQLRLYRRQRGLFGFLGDRLLAERRLVRTARFDRFERQYRIQESGAAETRFTQPSSFLQAFCSLSSLSLGPLPQGEAAGCYVLGRARLTPVKIVFPLGLITLFYPQTSFLTPWQRQELAR
jgi:hypothetical protein